MLQLIDQNQVFQKAACVIVKKIIFEPSSKQPEKESWPKNGFPPVNRININIPIGLSANTGMLSYICARLFTFQSQHIN